MSTDRWQRLNDIFHAALALAPDVRPAYLAKACADDDSLRRESEELLQAHHHAEQGLGAVEQLALSLNELAPPVVVGRRFGAYRASAEIGRGGMGTVLLADRVDGQFAQRVAIKLIKRGMDTAQILERFRVERQILASLDHPHIARLVDGGTTEDGLPYFVMEYIEGQPIDRYADEQRLSVRQRLDLFLQVCDAVSHAHQHLIVHRDIKPQNILVTGSGMPKLLDFGIAKVLQDASDPGTLTISGHQLLTPEYASPEQVEGRQTTTQTDVYSLGVVLYELLTGRSPYRPRTWSTPELCELVRSSEVERPSTAVGRPAGTTPRRSDADTDCVTARGAGSLDRLRVQLRGDLDAIVLSALHKDAARRYGSVEQLASDIRRHLSGLPVRARADSLWYRGAKFARRNRAGVTAAGLIALTLIGGTVATAWQARNARTQARLAQEAQTRAERRFAEVRKLANAVLFDYHDAIQHLPGATPIRGRLVRDALEYLNSLAAEAVGDTSLQRELALAYRRVAEVQGGMIGGIGLGDTSGAIDSQRKSLGILEALLAASSNDSRAQYDVADGALQLASLLALTADQAEALAHARRAQSLYEPLMSASALNLDQRLALARAYDVIGTVSLESGKPADALEIHGRQLRLLESAPPSDHGRPDLRRALSVAYQHMADAQGTFGDYQPALESIRRSLQIRMALSTEFPDNTDYRGLVASGHYWEADALVKLGRFREALQAYLRCLAASEALAAADPGHRTTFVLVRVGNVLSRLGDHEQALGYFRRAQAMVAADFRADPQNLWKRAGLIESEAFMCAALRGLARHAAASAACGETLKLIEQTTVEPTNAVVRASLARSYTAMADAYVGIANDRRSSPTQQLTLRSAALDMYQKSVAIWGDMSARGMLTPSDDAEAAAVSKSLRETEAGLGRPTGKRQAR